MPCIEKSTRLCIGTTAIAANSFITHAEASAGLKFTPALNFQGDATFQIQAGRVRQTRYRRVAWHSRDIVVVAACVLAVGAFAAARLAVPEALYYSPYPPSALWPPFQPVAGAALLLLAAPALVAPATLELKP